MAASLLPWPLPDGVTEHYLYCSAAELTFHFLQAGYVPGSSKPLILLLHGYPELSFSWRHILPSLSKDYHVVAPDQRGYGRTTGWDTSPYASTDLSQFTMTNLVHDLLSLVWALGHRSVHCVIGHDFGAVSAAMCALMRPDVFKRVMLMSHPFKGSPELPFSVFEANGNGHGADDEPTEDASETKKKSDDIHAGLASLQPPRKHYKWYNSTSAAASDWANPAQGLPSFLRGYIHLKSGEWTGNHNVHPLTSWTARELASLPEYYIMPLHSSMPEAVSALMAHVPASEQSATYAWLSEEALSVYVSEWSRTGFQGGLNWYRAQTEPGRTKDVELFAGKKIEVPAVFVSGDRDWGNVQEPGALESMARNCSDFRGVRLIRGAGHWPQQERPADVVREILAFVEE